MKELKCPHCGKTFQVDEADYESIVSQVRNDEFKEELKEELKIREDALKRELEASRKASDAEAETAHIKALGEKDRALAAKEKEISELRAKLSEQVNAVKIAVLEEQQKVQQQLNRKEAEITQLKGQAELDRKEAELQQKALKEQHANELKAKEEQVAFYKDFKARQSTKMIGESLERYCWDLFEGVRLTGYRNAYFEKDNEVVEGSKGDFVFRDFTEDGMEYISIMFEMKNEADSTAEKHRNSDFFEKLHKDRNRKKCEYAVLVSMLESDSERYNAGIVEVPQYEKMYVVRPQCFLPIIQILRDVARRTIEDRKALIAERNKNIDITNFEEELMSFKARFGQNILNSQKKFQEAIDAIDKSIKDLVKVKEALNLSIKHLGAADNKLEDLTIRKLTRNNPTMKGLFEEARALKEKTEAEEVEGELD